MRPGFWDILTWFKGLWRDNGICRLYRDKAVLRRRMKVLGGLWALRREGGHQRKTVLPNSVHFRRYEGSRRRTSRMRRKQESKWLHQMLGWKLDRLLKVFT